MTTDDADLASLDFSKLSNSADAFVVEVLVLSARVSEILTGEEEKWGKALGQLTKDELRWSELLVRMVVDHFLQYLNDLLVTIEPERNEAEESLNWRKLCQAFARYADRFVLIPSQSDYELTNQIIESRHILVHRGGTIDQKAATRIPAFTDRVGEPLNTRWGDAIKYQVFMLRLVHDIDQRAAMAFGLGMRV